MQQSIFVRTTVFLLGGLLIVTLLVWQREQKIPYVRSGIVQAEAASEFWSEEIKKRGPQAAVEMLRTHADTLSSFQAHALTHAFGGALYDITGTEELPLCPAEYSQGCAHELIGSAIADQGLSAVDDLFETCTSEGTSKYVCMHSIGHGVLGFLGYDDAALVKALDVCREHDPHARGSCLDGAFMEYFLRFLAAGGNIEPRLVDPERPFGPCASVDAWYAPACAFELPRWKLYAEHAEATPERLANLGSDCSAIPGERLSRACFEGLGTLASIESREPDGALATCINASSERTEYLYCVTGVVRHLHYWNTPAYEAVCTNAGLSENEDAYCRAYADTEIERVDELPLFTH